MSLYLHVLPAGPIETNAYLLTDTARGEAVLIDAPGEVWRDVKPILEREACVLKELWLTHGHWDHMQGVAEVVAATGAQVSAHADDKILLETPLPGTIRLAPVKVARWVKQGDRVTALGLEWEIRHVPGHCPGSVLFWCAAQGLAFSGDAIFRRSVGRTDFPNCGFPQLEKSIRTQIYTLPAETILYPGHGGPTTVAEERAENPHVRG
ncbi:MAG: MBL fold metallo-hydrolase [Verrucomicrobia bacterium]|nr:MBL fold metallo-hydrolase [Verrucomicrobiota bacterium]